MESKREKIMELFFDNPTREWHFEEVVKEAKIARSKADGWLKKFIKEGLIKKIKESEKDIKERRYVELDLKMSAKEMDKILTGD